MTKLPYTLIPLSEESNLDCLVRLSINIARAEIGAEAASVIRKALFGLVFHGALQIALGPIPIVYSAASAANTIYKIAVKTYKAYKEEMTRIYSQYEIEQHASIVVARKTRDESQADIVLPDQLKWELVPWDKYNGLKTLSDIGLTRDENTPTYSGVTGVRDDMFEIENMFEKIDPWLYNILYSQIHYTADSNYLEKLSLPNYVPSSPLELRSIGLISAPCDECHLSSPHHASWCSKNYSGLKRERTAHNRMFPQKHQGRFDDIQVEHQVEELNRKGIRILLSFVANFLPYKTCKAIVYFYPNTSDQVRPKGLFEYSTLGGDACVGKSFMPAQSTAVYNNFPLFMPYDKLILPEGVHFWKLQAELHNLETNECFAISDYLPTFMMCRSGSSIFSLAKTF